MNRKESPPNSSRTEGNLTNMNINLRIDKPFHRTHDEATSRYLSLSLFYPMFILNLCLIYDFFMINLYVTGYRLQVTSDKVPVLLKQGEARARTTCPITRGV